MRNPYTILLLLVLAVGCVSSRPAHAPKEVPEPIPVPEYTSWDAAKQRAFAHDLVTRGFPDDSPFTQAAIPNLHDLCGVFVAVGDESSIPFILATMKELVRHPEGCAFSHCHYALEKISGVQLRLEVGDEEILGAWVEKLGVQPASN